MPPAPSLPLDRRVAVVSGAGTGIGRAISLRLAELGANVGVNFKESKEGAQETAHKVEEVGRKATLLPGDVGREADVRKIADAVRRALGDVDILINNAGHGSETDEELPERWNLRDWQRVVDTNLTGAFLMTRQFAPEMIRRKAGRIVNISSICGVTGDCGPAYCASKAGVLGLTRACATRLAPYVQVYAILPGFIRHRVHEGPRTAKAIAITPDGRIAEPTEIGELVGFLTSMKSSFLTGSCIVMDGGVTLGSIGLPLDWIPRPGSAT